MSNIRAHRYARTTALALGAAFGVASFSSHAQLTVGATGTKATIGGYVKLDAVFNTRSVGGVGDTQFIPPLIPVGTASPGERKQITLQARESRLFLRTTTPTAMGDMLTHLEFDFFGGNLNGNEVVSNSHGARLRHAYGALGPWLVGQTWTLFMDVTALPETLDFGGGVGETFVRQPQVRYTQKFGGGQFAVSLESPETVVQSIGPVDDDRLPDIIASLGLNTGFGRYTVAGMFRRLRADSPAGAPALVNATETGGGITLMGVVPSVGKDTVHFQFTAGKGIGRYFEGNLPEAFVKNGTALDASGQYGGQVAYRHFWTDTLRSTVNAAVLYADNANGIAALNPGANKRFQSIHANLLYSPVPNVTTGVEYIFGKRTTEGNGSGILQRVMASAKLAF